VFNFPLISFTINKHDNLMAYGLCLIHLWETFCSFSVEWWTLYLCTHFCCAFEPRRWLAM